MLSTFLWVIVAICQPIFTRIHDILRHYDKEGTINIAMSINIMTVRHIMSKTFESAHICTAITEFQPDDTIITLQLLKQDFYHAALCCSLSDRNAVRHTRVL